MAEKRVKIIFILIIIQPIIDMMTSLSMEKFPISVGALCKTLIMGILFIYIFIFLYTYMKKVLWLYIASFSAIIITMIITIVFKQHFHLFEEINFMLKTSYYVVMTFTAIIWIENKWINQTFVYHAAKVISLIIGASYWIAVLTNTSVNSYTYEKAGYSGWFYAANELSVTVIILLALTLIHLRYENSFSTWLAFALMLSMTPMIGTKTAFAGSILIIFCYIIYLLIQFNFQILKEQWRFFSIVIIFICMLPFSPMIINTTYVDMSTPPAGFTSSEKAVEAQTSFIGKILSSRNIYFQQTKDDFLQAHWLRKAFGLGYAGDDGQGEKLIEMDFFDLFFSYGVIGCLLLLAPMLFLGRMIISRHINIEKFLLLLAIGLCFGISFLAGHVLFAPSVMTYIMLLFVGAGLSNGVRRDVK